MAWIAELFDDPKQREAALGYTQAFSSLGGLMVTGDVHLAVDLRRSVSRDHGSHRRGVTR